MRYDGEVQVPSFRRVIQYTGIVKSYLYRVRWRHLVRDQLLKFTTT